MMILAAAAATVGNAQAEMEPRKMSPLHASEPIQKHIYMNKFV
jgi:hypothetical protein